MTVNPDGLSAAAASAYLEALAGPAIAAVLRAALCGASVLREGFERGPAHRRGCRPGRTRRRRNGGP
jgi:hypothetical protein